uniref:RNA polymerase sigma factor n=1 Tax=Chlorobium chlorochromatii (strain CaD3) TaxID=340177 RepID=Q3APD6_CHLCH
MYLKVAFSFGRYSMEMDAVMTKKTITTTKTATSSPPKALSAAEQKRQLEFQREAIVHLNSLYNYALHLTMNADDAEDLVQETYLKAYRFFDSFEKGTNCKAWLFKILKNNYINRFRKDTREPGFVDYDAIKDFYHTIKDVQSDTSETESDYFHSLLHEEVYQALKSLPEEFREVIQLCDIEGFTYEEIANMVESPIGTVRSRLYRGRKLLHEQLKEYAEKHGWHMNDAPNNPA